jgi:hypothetical protein
MSVFCSGAGEDLRPEPPGEPLTKNDVVDFLRERLRVSLELTTPYIGSNAPVLSITLYIDGASFGDDREEICRESIDLPTPPST